MSSGWRRVHCRIVLGCWDGCLAVIRWGGAAGEGVEGQLGPGRVGAEVQGVASGGGGQLPGDGEQAQP
jgi:hypothetical protein